MKYTLLAALFVLPFLALPALAADGPPKPHHAHVRVTWQQKFAQANATHDGHLTSEQAQAGDKTLFKHFAEIDTGKRGFVTLEDVKAWHKQRRAARHTATPNPLRPHHAFLRTNTPPAVRASTAGVVPNTSTTVGPVATHRGDAPG